MPVQIGQWGVVSLLRFASADKHLKNHLQNHHGTWAKEQGVPCTHRRSKLLFSHSTVFYKERQSLSHCRTTSCFENVAYFESNHSCGNNFYWYRRQRVNDVMILSSDLNRIRIRDLCDTGAECSTNWTECFSDFLLIHWLTDSVYKSKDCIITPLLITAAQNPSE